MYALDGIRAELRNDYRLTEFLVILPEIGFKKRLYGSKISYFVIPAVISVKRNKIEQIGALVVLVELGFFGRGYRQIGERARMRDHFLEIISRFILVSRRFVGNAYHNHARVIFVPFPQKRKKILMQSKRFFVRSALSEGVFAPMVHSDRGNLVDNEYSVTVGEIVNFLGVRIMTRADRICVYPLQKFEISYVYRRIVSFSRNEKVLVLAEAFEIYGLIV